LILVDVNLLIYAHVRAAPDHDRARIWLDEQISSGTRVALPWHSLLGFLRIVTNARMTAPVEPLAAALAQIEAWLSPGNVWIPAPSERHAALISSLLLHANRGGKLVSDAHLAALAIEHGLTLCSTDADFARFPGLRWLNPLAP
jgi:uncharacterized protein